MNKKVVALVLACVLIFSTIVAGTLAWLQVKTEKITNTFSFGNINITLTETTGALSEGARNFELIPGQVVAKDPTVTVAEGSEKAWIFVEVTKSANLDTFIDYAAADEWEKLSVDGKEIYAYKTVVDAENSAQTLYFLKGNAENESGIVTCKDVTKKDVDDLSKPEAIKPELSFVAYAVQAEAGASATAAWTATFGAPAVQG